MNCIDHINAALKSNIQQYINDGESGEQAVELDDSLFDKPTNPTYGDISTNVAFKYAKLMGLAPYQLAQKISQFLSEKQLDYVDKVAAVEPGFINITLNNEFYRTLTQTILDAPLAYGRNNSLAGTTWVVEHTSPNPNKAMHLGHLRNNLVGMSLVRLLGESEAKVFSDAVDNNRGIAIAKLMWGFIAHMKKTSEADMTPQAWVQNKQNWYTPEEKDLLPDIFITNCYLLGTADFKKDKAIEIKVRDLVVKWESGDEVVRELWSHLLAYAHAGMNRTLKRVGNHWDKVWHEHEHYEAGRQYVFAGLKKGSFRKLEDGAILSNLANYNLPDTVLLKNDGTSLYITQDIALTELKKKHYQADNLVWVVGMEQSLALRQLFAVCEQLGIGRVSDFTHVSYGYVGLKNEDGGFKRMSSREGSVILIDDVIDDVRDKIAKRLKAEKYNDKEASLLAEKLALAAVKFNLLKSDRKQDLTFDAEQSIETSGDSGIYVLYAYVRIASILNKQSAPAIATNNTYTEIEIPVLRQLAYFPKALERAREDLSAHHIAQYLLELCSAFNTWYGQDIILDGKEREAHKLAIATAVGVVIKNGLSILGIETVKKI